VAFFKFRPILLTDLQAASLTMSQSEAAVLTKEQEMLQQAIDASHRSAVEDEVID
jgi:hypothetical protein